MKLLKCEVCGSAELTKRDGLFVCDYCGAKYELEEVQKMAISGKTDVSGSIAIDDSTRLRSFVQAAYDACEDLHYDEAKRHAEQALSIDPNNSDSLFVLAIYEGLYGGTNFESYCRRAKKYADESLGIIT